MTDASGLPDEHSASRKLVQALPQDNEPLREKLAAIEHERWADWQKWCHEVLRGNSPSLETLKVLERWDKQIATPYKDLSRKEQLSDREQVDRYWPLFQAEQTRLKAQIEKEIKDAYNL